MWHRPLSEMLTDVVEAVEAAATAGLEVRARQVELTLPIEVRLLEVGGESTFIGDLPVWRWRTDFDLLPGKLRIVYETSDI